MKNFTPILCVLLTLVFASRFSSGSYTQVSKMPPGTVIPFAGAFCPTGSLPADGSSQLRAGVYANLYHAILTAHGAADGTHFNLPDLRGRFIRGTDNMGSTAGAAGRDPGAGSRTAAATGGNTGNNVGSIQTQTTAVNGLHDTGHSHTRNPSGTQEFVLFNSGGGSGWSAGPDNSTATNTTTGTSTANLSGDTETRPINVAINYCIWY